MRLFPVLLPALALIAACASHPPAEDANNNQASPGLSGNVEEAAGDAYTQTKAGLPEAAMSPLEDLNLKREPIPKVLSDIESPYDLPGDLSCADIAHHLAELDAVLGPDWDTPNPDDRLRTEKLADAASAAALDTVSSGASSIIPFRSLVRRATGAYAYQKKYNQAFSVGAQRRAYLKGLGLAKDCPAPARPNPPAPKDEDIVFKGDAPTPRPAPRSEPEISYGPTRYVVGPEDPQTGLPR
ncbi:MAG: hypothetical protein R3C00_04240 [Hyphomonas sp.]|nr:hypothetical protein [Hyphomonas sp.]MCB9963218.1 hypothetical protein [Hyphomonas sp.]MCB9971382.1 hypothetical protein [Hyphomonas sp.]